MQAMPGPSNSRVPPPRQTSSLPKPPPIPAARPVAKSPLPGPIRRSVAALPSRAANANPSLIAGAASAAEKSQSAKTLADSYRCELIYVPILVATVMSVADEQHSHRIHESSLGWL